MIAGAVSARRRGSAPSPWVTVALLAVTLAVITAIGARSRQARPRLMDP